MIIYLFVYRVHRYTKFKHLTFELYIGDLLLFFTTDGEMSAVDIIELYYGGDFTTVNRRGNYESE